ncbi:THO complex subunit 1 [Strongylocentrotus purpuratus]|uniref:Death domain-containing protein n=1 Tax=Strongylocentrotus purpuratus TaxID=7668 RepID=A0A7M7NNS4_STRPU|nr:THO complex subunit 1 [Strongylocentrotus purpuratus]
MATSESRFDFEASRGKYLISLDESRKKQSVSCLKKCADSLEGSDAEKKTALDQAYRNYVKKLVVGGSSCSDFTSLVHLSTEAVEAGLCSPATPFLLLTDIFDSVTISVCKDVFQFVEDRVATWKQSDFYSSGKNYLLRMCNDLLRRLSKSQDMVFCGRIQLFLARFFPLDEKSGLNLMSNFHLDNVTSYNRTKLEGPLRTRVPQAIDKQDSMDYEEGEMGSATPVDYKLYRQFWALQDFFRAPLQCYTKEKWKDFSNNAIAVLEAFHSMKLEDVASGKKKKKRRSHHRQQQKQGEEEEADSGDQVSFAKYLTSEKLFDLQLSDAMFRRYVYVQFLILFQYLNQQVKFKQAHHVLTDEMSLFIKETKDKVVALLKETPPYGDQFTAGIEHILSREEHWNAWKNEGCPSYVKEKGKTEQARPKSRARKRTLGEELNLAGAAKKIDLGSPELTKLWNVYPSNLEACAAEDRIFLPQVEEFFQDAIDQADPEAMIEPEYKVVNNSNYAWQAIRLLAKRSPHFFQTVTATNPPLKTVPGYLEYMVTKIAKELPQNEESKPEELKTEEETTENDELLKGPEEGMDKSPSAAVTEEQFTLVASKIGDSWQTLAVELGFSDDEVTAILSETSDIKEQTKLMLQQWQDKEGAEPSRETLIAGLMESGLDDIVESVFMEKQKKVELVFEEKQKRVVENGEGIVAESEPMEMDS